MLRPSLLKRVDKENDGEKTQIVPIPNAMAPAPLPGNNLALSFIIPQKTVVPLLKRPRRDTDTRYCFIDRSVDDRWGGGMVCERLVEKYGFVEFTEAMNIALHERLQTKEAYTAWMRRHIDFWWICRRGLFLCILDGQNKENITSVVSRLSKESFLTEKTKLSTILWQRFKEKAWEFFPESYVLHKTKDETINITPIRKRLNDVDTWICKHPAKGCGIGITICHLGDLPKVEVSDDVYKFGVQESERSKKIQAHMDTTYEEIERVVCQRYLGQPMLYQGKKFDIRTYLFVASASPLVAFHHPGFCRISGKKYVNKDFEDISIHLTNVSVAREGMGLDRKVVSGADDAEFRVFLVDLCKDILSNYPNLVDKWLAIDSEEKEEEMDDAQKIKLMEAFIMARIEENVVRCLDAASRYISDMPLTNEISFLGVDTMIDASGNFWLLEFTRACAIRRHIDDLRDHHEPMMHELVDITMQTVKLRDDENVDLLSHDFKQKLWKRMNFDA